MLLERIELSTSLPLSYNSAGPAGGALSKRPARAAQPLPRSIAPATFPAMNAPPEKPPAQDDRAARRAAALRENLKRRKAQARAREAAPAEAAPAKVAPEKPMG